MAKFKPLLRTDFSWSVITCSERLRANVLEPLAIRILQADKGNCSVMIDEIEYREKIDTLLKSGVYEALSKDPAAKIERKVQQIPAKYKTVLPAEVKRKFTP
jgi:hypothetical protein